MRTKLCQACCNFLATSRILPFPFDAAVAISRLFYFWFVIGICIVIIITSLTVLVFPSA